MQDESKLQGIPDSNQHKAPSQELIDPSEINNSNMNSAEYISAKAVSGHGSAAEGDTAAEESDSDCDLDEAAEVGEVVSFGPSKVPALSLGGIGKPTSPKSSKQDMGSVSYTSTLIISLFAVSPPHCALTTTLTI